MHTKSKYVIVRPIYDIYINILHIWQVNGNCLIQLIRKHVFSCENSGHQFFITNLNIDI